MLQGNNDTALNGYFEILGLLPGASLGEVKKASRKLFLKHHPDLNPADRPACEEKTKKIVEAYRAVVFAMRHEAGPAGEAGEEETGSGPAPDESFDVLVFEISRFTMAVPSGCVREILRFKDVRIDDFGVGAGATPYLAGVFSRGGEVTMLWNLHSQFGLREITIGSDFGNSKIVVVAFAGSSVSFLVNDIRGIMNFTRGSLMPPASAAETDISYIEGIINTEDGPIGLLDLKKVLSDCG